MTKKDVFIALQLYLLAVRDKVNLVIIEDFKSSIYNLLINFDTFEQFRFQLSILRLEAKYNSIYKNFYYYLEKFMKICY